MTKQKKSVGRRSHRKLDALPVESQAVVEKMIVNNKWPKDFKTHYRGTPRLCDVVLYCREKGYSVSKSAIGRFAKQIQTVSVQRIKDDSRPYVMACLAEACGDFANLQSDLMAAAVHPELMKGVMEGRPNLSLLAEQDIARIETILADLKRLK
jgi:hypothetical protein